MTQPKDDELERTRARIVELEVRYTHQERLIAELSDVLYEQRRALDQAVRRVTALEQRLNEASSTPRPRDPKDEVPPHY